MNASGQRRSRRSPSWRWPRSRRAALPPCRSTGSPSRWACPVPRSTGTSRAATSSCAARRRCLRRSRRDAASARASAPPASRRPLPRRRRRLPRLGARASGGGTRSCSAGASPEATSLPRSRSRRSERCSTCSSHCAISAPTGRPRRRSSRATSTSQLRSWAHARGAGDDLPPWLLRLAIVSWQRPHGHIGLELEGVHAAMGISSDALYRTELDAIVAEATERS